MKIAYAAVFAAAVVCFYPASAAIDDGAFIHLDAAGSEFGIVVSNGVCHVSRWYDVRGFSYRSAVAQAPGPIGALPSLQCGGSPWLEESGFLDGRMAVSTGGFSGDESRSDDSGAFIFDTCNVRAGFIVCRPKSNLELAFPLACSYGNNYHFHRGIGGRILIGEYADAAVKSGEWRLDGALVDPLEATIPTDRFSLLSFTIAEGRPVNSLSHDRDCRIGGMEYAEVLLFDTAIDSARRAEIEADMMARWLSPAPAAVSPLKFDSVSFASGEPAALDVDCDVEAGSIVGSGAFRKDGTGTLSMHMPADFSSVTVAAGTLSVAASAQSIVGSADFHIDATDMSTIATNAEGLVTRIDDAGGNGRFATVDLAASAASGAALATDPVSGLKTLDMGEFSGFPGTGEGTCAFDWSEELTGLHTIFVVFGRMGSSSSQFFLASTGDSGNGKWPFHGANGTICHSIIDSHPIGVNFRRYATWSLDGVPVEDPCDADKGGALVNDRLHVLAVRLPGGYEGAYANAIGLDRNLNTGGIRYGEIVVFRRALSDGEFAAVENHLLDKWACRPALDSVLERAYLHFDPSDADSLAFEPGGRVARIDDVRGNGLYASKTAVSKAAPALTQSGMLDFGTYAAVVDNDYSAIPGDTGSFRFDRMAEGLHTVFVVVERHGTVDNGAFLLGCSDDGGSAWYPFHSTGGRYLHNICRSANYAGNNVGLAVLNAAWTIDGVEYSGWELDQEHDVEFVPDTMHVIGIDISDAYGTVAEMLAHDRYCSIGGIAYGEILLFKERLSKYERSLVYDYLREKWQGVEPAGGQDGFSNAIACPPLAIGVGARFAVDGNIAFADGTALSFTLPVAPSGAISVDGTVAVGGNIALSLNVPAGAALPPGIFRLAGATAMSFADDPSQWTIGGNLADRCGFAVESDGSSLLLRILPAGLAIFVK